MSLVSFVKIENNNRKQAISSSLDLIDYNFPKNVRRVIIKVNLCYYWDYSTGQTTDPKFVGALIDLIRSRTSSDVSISIVETDASAMKCRHAFKFLGYEKLARVYGVELVNLSEDKCDASDVTVNGHTYRFLVPKAIANSDFRVNVTQIKYSLNSIKITCALKNVFGCNPYPRKFIYHTNLNEAIVAINKAMKFDLCLVDGNIVAGDGVRKIGLVMGSEDPVAVDAAAAEIAGVNPNSIKYLKLACAEGLGTTRYVEKGVPLKYFRDRFPRKTPRKKLMGKAFDLVLLLKLGRRLGLE